MNRLAFHFKKLRIFPVLLLIMFLLSGLPLVTKVEAQNYAPSVSGDDLCGRWDPNLTTKVGSTTVQGAIAKRCTIDEIGVMAKKVLTIVVSVGLPLLVVFITYRFVMAWFALQQGNANAYKEALKQSGNALLGFFFVVALFGGLMMILLKYLGVKDEVFPLLKLLSDAFIPHAYAAGEPKYLPNFVQATSIYDLILSVLELVMRFFIYPSLIVMWVWTGFAFVLAQGAPEAINKAKKWLMWAFVTTLVIFLLQAFLVAVQGTVERILGTSSATSSGSYIPAPGTYGAACGNGGMIGTDGTCTTGRSGTTVIPSGSCVGKPLGTMCSVTVANGTSNGTCSNNTDGTFGCYIAQVGDMCLSDTGVRGVIGSNYRCEVSNSCTGKANGTMCDISSGGKISPGTCSYDIMRVFDCYAAQPGKKCITGVGAFGAFDTNLRCVAGLTPTAL